uniref:Alkaline phosphatase n=1 Tax=Arion vulgaris TaxID=1028688 RepID=A0A0B6YV85_9EUPU
MASSIPICLLLLGYFIEGVKLSTTPVNYGYERVSTYWYDLAEEELFATLRERQMGVAKNVILFLGDGMGMSTVTAGRILAGQKLGKRGEEHKLSFDKFPYTGLSRTYNTNSQITDSASSATAFLSGVKTNQGLLGLNGSAKRGICNTTTGAHAESILRWSANAGKSTGIVTTTRVTHATPGAAYAHSAERDWESDRAVPASEKDCEDIALQLVVRNSDINVIMGGGRANFYPEGYPDPNHDPTFNTTKASRLDNRNLVEEWKSEKKARNANHQFVYDKAGLDKVDVSKTNYLLGLFKQSHMSYEVVRNATQEPSLTDMVEKAIGILSKNKNGFFLLVEGGRIDHGHHDTQASLSLHEVVAFADAVEMATRMTSKSETLMVVTADHSHVMNIAGYASRGNPILGLSDINGAQSLKSLDKMPYTTIVYGNGPGYNSTRTNLTDVNTQDKYYVYQSAVPMKSETHGGEDVPIYATGPHSVLFTGVHEQNYIPMAVAYASCVGPYEKGKKGCAKQEIEVVPPIKCKVSNSNTLNKSSTILAVLSLLLVIYL